MVVFMKRTALEKKLREMGWAPLGQRSGKGHMAWVSRFGSLSVPMTTDSDELILDSVGNDILAEARKLGGEE